MRKTFFNWFTRCDIFGTEINLKYHKDNLFRTSFGGFMTIVLIGALIFIFQNTVIIYFTQHLSNTYFIQQPFLLYVDRNFPQQMQNMMIYIFNKNIILFGLSAKVTAVTSLSYDTDSSAFEIGSGSFMIAVKYDQANFVARPKMNITFEARHYQRYKNGTHIKNRTLLYLEPCTIEHFKNIPSHNYNLTQAFYEYNMTDFLCLKKDQSFQIGGAFESEHFYHIKYSLSKCINSTNQNQPWKPVCDEPKNINIADTNQRVNFIITNTILNPEKPIDPAQTYLYSMIFSASPEKMIAQTNVMITSQIMSTDVSITPQKQNEEEKFVILKNGDYTDSYQIGNYTNYCEVYFLRSPFSSVHRRTFVKLDQLISYIGGFCQIFVLIVAILGNTTLLQNLQKEQVDIL